MVLQNNSDTTQKTISKMNHKKSTKSNVMTKTTEDTSLKLIDNKIDTTETYDAVLKVSNGKIDEARVDDKHLKLRNNEISITEVYDTETTLLKTPITHKTVNITPTRSAYKLAQEANQKANHLENSMADILEQITSSNLLMENNMKVILNELRKINDEKMQKNNIPLQELLQNMKKKG